MKIKFRYMMMAAVAAFAMTSCDVSSIDDLEGIYGAPQDATVTGATVADKTKDGNLRTYTMDFTTKEGNAIHLVMLSDQYYILGTTYSLADASTAKKGNFISGQSTVNGSAITDGSFTMTKNDDDYVLTRSTLFTADGKSYAVTGSFNYPFEPDDPTALPVLKYAVDNGNGTVTAVFSTGTYTESYDAATYSMVYSGEGNDLQIVFNSADGKLHEGTYSPGTGYVVGYEFENDTYAAWGLVYTDYAGTLWYTIADGAKTPTLVTSGDIVVTKNGSTYTILLDQGKGGIYAQYEGPIADLNPDGAAAATELTYGGGVSWVAYGGNTVALSFAGPGATIGYNSTYWSFVAGGTGVAFNVEFYSADGTLAPGTYTPAENGAVGEGNWLKGYDNGYGGFSGSVFHNVAADADTASALTDGTFTVTKDGDNYTITATINGVDYVYNGPITI